MPGGRAHPAGAISLDRLDDSIGARQVTEADEHLVQHHLVVDLRAAGDQQIGDAAGVGAGLVDKVRNAVPAEFLEGCPDREATRPARRLGVTSPSTWSVPPEPVKYAAT